MSERKLSQYEASTLFTTLIPGCRLNAKGRCRMKPPHRSGHNPTSFEIYTSHGGGFRDFGTDEKGDCIDLVKILQDTDFKGACRVISGIIGRGLLDASKPVRPRLSHDALTRAARFRVGVLWRIDVELEKVKTQLFGEKHDQAAAACKCLTDWRLVVQSWSVYKTAEVLKQSSRRTPRLVQEAIAEAATAELELARSITGVFGEESEAA